MRIASWHVLLLAVSTLAILAVVLGCNRPRIDGNGVPRSTALAAASSSTANARTARRPVESSETLSQASNLPLEIDLQSPEVPEQIREPSPPVPEKPQK